MKEKIECSLIKDILPLYIDKLTTQETNQIIGNHLKDCESCNQIYQAIKEEIPSSPSRPLEEKELDYLKKIRDRNKKKIGGLLGGISLLIMIFIIIKVFVYGSPTQQYVSKVSVKNGIIKIAGTVTQEGMVYSHHKLQKRDGKTQLVLYGAKSTFWNRNGAFEIQCNVKEIKEQGLEVAEKKVTEKGNIVSLLAAGIYEKKHPYIGDMPKNSALAIATGMVEEVGGFSNELQTSQEPYGWTLHFIDALESSNEHIFNEKMKGYACVLLATVGNVSEIRWSYQVREDGGVHEKIMKLSVTEAGEMLGKDIKSFGKSEESLEILLIKVGLRKKGI